MNLRKGISPVIATVIIVAVALAIAIAAVGWVMGIWGSVTGGTETLKIYPDSYIDASNNQLVLHVKNEGGGTGVIYKIEVSGATNVSITDTSGDITSSGTEVTVPAGAEGTIYASITGTLTPGAVYTVKIYTKAGNVYTAQVTAK